MANQNPNPFRPLVHWFITPPHAVRFVSQMNGSIDIEFEPGREDEIADYMIQWINAHRDRSLAMAVQTAPATPAALAAANGQPDPNCPACTWAKEHPTTQCSIHSAPNTPNNTGVRPPVQETPPEMRQKPKIPSQGLEALLHNSDTGTKTGE